MSVATHFKKQKPEKFGTVIGTGPGGVPAYSSDYDSSDYTSRRQYWGNYEGIYTGYRYQCVEYARRWLVQTQGITFGDVGMAYEVMRIPSFNIVDKEDEDGKGAPIELARTENGGKGHVPVLGSVILWRPQGFFRHTGHIAIITHCSFTSEKTVQLKYEDGTTKEATVKIGKVGVAEQNVTDAMWGEGQNFARELDIEFNTITGHVTMADNHYANTLVLGWVTPKQTLESGSVQLSKV